MPGPIPKKGHLGQRRQPRADATFGVAPIDIAANRALPMINTGIVAPSGIVITLDGTTAWIDSSGGVNSLDLANGTLGPPDTARR